MPSHYLLSSISISIIETEEIWIDIRKVKKSTSHQVEREIQVSS